MEMFLTDKEIEFFNSFKKGEKINFYRDIDNNLFIDFMYKNKFISLIYYSDYDIITNEKEIKYENIKNVL